MASAKRRAEHKNHRILPAGKRCSIYTGKPGVPDWMRTNAMKVNRHDHSATLTKRPTWFEVGGVKIQIPHKNIRAVARMNRG